MFLKRAAATSCTQYRRGLKQQWQGTDVISRSHERIFHSSRLLEETLSPQYESRGLGDFYKDLLETPLPRVAKAKTAVDLPEWVASGGRKDIEERARKLFGTIEGSGYHRQTSDSPDETWRTINGVPIPPRPSEPDNCCMSGCVHCVWDDYRDDIESWAARLREARAKSHGEGVTTTPKAGFSRSEVHAASTSMDDDGGGSEALWQVPSAGAEEDELFAGIPVGIREFMATEKRIRERKKSRNRAKMN